MRLFGKTERNIFVSFGLATEGFEELPNINIVRKELISQIGKIGFKRMKPKISDFGAVDDEGKRSISLWHKQTPGIPGVDFYLERLYNILQP